MITPFGACPARRAGPLRLCGAGRFGGTLSCTPDAPGRLCAAGGGALGLRCSRPLRSAPCALCAAFSWWPVGRLSALAAAVPRAPCRRRASPSPSGVVARAGVLVGFPAALSPRILNPSPALPSVAPPPPGSRAGALRFAAACGGLSRGMGSRPLRGRSLGGCGGNSLPRFHLGNRLRTRDFFQKSHALDGIFSPRTSPKTGQKTRQKSRPRAAFFLS